MNRYWVSLVATAVVLAGGNTGSSQDLAAHLVAQWTFDDDFGNVVLDSSANGFHGTSYDLQYDRGMLGEALVFDSTLDEVHIPARGIKPPALIGGLTRGSISVWFKFRNVGAQILPIFYFGEADEGAPHNSLIIEIGHGNNAENRKLYFTIVNARFCYDSGVNLDPDKWYHFVAVVSETGNTGYLNGQEMTGRHYNLGSNALCTDFFASVPVKEMLALGYGRYGQSDPFYHYKGSIDEVRVYDTPLDANDVSRLYQEVLGPVLTHEDVQYGPYERNVLDFWQADSNRPTPVVVFIHGGGFRSGDKTQIRTKSGLAEVATYLENGISFAAIDYRFRMTTTLDQIMLDCARAIQFLRFKSPEWNIDKTRIAAYGGSAGGGASIWLGFHNDLADPNSPDPVLWESSRLAAIGHQTSQATYDMVQWPDILGIDPNWAQTMGSVEELELYGIPDRSHLWDPNVVAMRAFLDMPAFMDPNDPPLYTLNLQPDTEPTTANAVIHHPRHTMFLRDRCAQIGIPCVTILADTPKQDQITLVDFFLGQLLAPRTDPTDPNAS